MITKEALAKMNKGMPTVDIKGKNYIMVNERIKRFREFVVGGRIETEIINLDDGVVTIKASVYDDEGDLIATGHAQEKETSSFINKTSFVENAETSAIGRALGIAGIGIDDSLGSADEVANAIKNQEKKPKKENKEVVNDREKKVFIERCKALGQEPTDILKKTGWTEGLMTVEQHGKALIILKEIEESSEA